MAQKFRLELCIFFSLSYDVDILYINYRNFKTQVLASALHILNHRCDDNLLAHLISELGSQQETIIGIFTFFDKRTLRDQPPLSLLFISDLRALKYRPLLEVGYLAQGRGWRLR